MHERLQKQKEASCKSSSSGSKMLLVGLFLLPIHILLSKNPSEVTISNDNIKSKKLVCYTKVQV